ncbi:MAG: hypothetical protein OCC45_10100 [Desulfotalea sp.]
MKMLNIIIVVIAAIVTGTQTILLLLQQEAICFNSGCEIVESLTKVPPEIFNIAGFLYFVGLAYLLIKVRINKTYSTFWEKLTSLALLGGVAAEGVLFSFQHFVIDTYCSYCLIILCFVVVANLLFSWQQFMRAVSVFVAVIIAFSVLSFAVPNSGQYTLKTGSYGFKPGVNIDEERFFFFSKTCPHCEEVIAGIDEKNNCNINFNPVSELDGPPLEKMTLMEKYDSSGNISFLGGLGILEVPVLVVTNSSGGKILKGKKAINNYFNENCYPGKSDTDSYTEVLPETGTGESSVMTNKDGFDFLVPEDDGNCTIESTEPDCE